MNTRRLISLVVVLFALAIPLAAQTPAKELLKKAKTAFDDEDRDLARELYLQVIDLDPEESDAYYRLGLLADSPEDAIDWFKQYVDLEPDDAWGWLALGDKFSKVKKSLEARDAYERAAKLAPDAEEVREGLARGKVRAAPGLAPLGGYADDSDGIHTWSYGLEGDLALRNGFRLGGRYRRSDIRGKLFKAAIEDYAVSLEGRPRMAVTLNMAFGLARYAAVEFQPDSPLGAGKLPNLKSRPWLTPQGELRFRWRKPDGGPAVDVRLQRLPFASSPQLAFNHAIQNDARLTAELPLGPFRVRGTGRISLIEAAAESSNTRVEGGGVIAFPFGWRGEISVQYHALGFARASTSGYFAPRSVETIEAGTYWELGGEGKWSAEVDLGAGVQRLARQSETSGPWKTALRGWGYIAYDIVSALQARVEVEAYSAPFSPIGAVSAENWRYFAITAGFLIRLF